MYCVLFLFESKKPRINCFYCDKYFVTWSQYIFKKVVFIRTLFLASFSFPLPLFRSGSCSWREREKDKTLKREVNCVLCAFSMQFLFLCIDPIHSLSSQATLSNYIFARDIILDDEGLLFFAFSQDRFWLRKRDKFAMEVGHLELATSRPLLVDTYRERERKRKKETHYILDLRVKITFSFLFYGKQCLPLSLRCIIVSHRSDFFRFKLLYSFSSWVMLVYSHSSSIRYTLKITITSLYAWLHFYGLSRSGYGVFKIPFIDSMTLKCLRHRKPYKLH